MLLIITDPRKGGDKVSPGEGGLTKWDFKITYSYFVYSVRFYANNNNINGTVSGNMKYCIFWNVKIVDSPRDKVSLEVSPILENLESESGPVPSAADSVSGDGLPIVTRSKDGQRTSCTYDEYLANQFGKDSSDDEVFELHVPLRTLESFLA